MDRKAALAELEEIRAEFHDQASALDLDVAALEILAPKEMEEAEALPLLEVLAEEPLEPKPPPVESPRPPRRWLRGAAALAALAALMAWGLARRRADLNAQARQSFALPLASTGALTVQGRVLWTVDPLRGVVFHYEWHGQQIAAKGIHKLPAASADALAAGGECLWSAQAAAGGVVCHEPQPPFAARRSYNNPESRPAALAWDGRHLWTRDARTGTISQFSSGETLFPLAQYTLPPLEAVGLEVARGLIWVYDASSGALQRFRPAGLLVAHDSLELKSLLPSTARVTDFVVEGESLWVVCENPAALHRFDLDRLPQRR